MKWTLLEQCSPSVKESELQSIFDHWGTDRNGWQVAGTPDWLAKCKNPIDRRSYFARNYDQYRFGTDVIWLRPERLVAELKLSAANQSVALAEVLHHAWWLSKDEGIGGKPFIPVVVVSSTEAGWIRWALKWLFDRGLAKESIRYLEATCYSLGQSRKFLWLEEPFAEWVPVSRPTFVPSNWIEKSAAWYRMSGSNSWVATEPKAEVRRPVIPHSLAMIARLDGSDDFLTYVWSGGKDVAIHLLERNVPSKRADVNCPPSPFTP
jgi:hypothetical protein